MNRVIQGSYAPGSTFKVIAATAALEEGLITPETTFYCPGQLNVYNTTFRCHPGGHGVVDLRRAIAVSCNVYFYQVGIRLEIARLAKWAKLMGLGAPTGGGPPAEAGGPVPGAGRRGGWGGAGGAGRRGRGGLGRDRARPGERDADPDGARSRVRGERRAAG